MSLRKSQTKQSVSIKNWWASILLLPMMVGAFLLRVIPQWNIVFVEGKVWYKGVDSWYHMRLVDNMVHNFPSLLRLDSYAAYPDGLSPGFYPLMGWIIAGLGQIFNYEVVGALLPPIAGTLVLIPVYFIGKELFSKGMGLLACLLVAVFPSELLHRSLLGFTDHHILETLLMTTTILFLILSVKYDKLRYIIGAGVFLGLYLLNWHGGAFFLFILGVWLLVEFIYLYIKDKPTYLLCRVVTISSSVALIISFPFFLVEIGGKVGLLALGLLIVSPFCLSLLSHIVKNKKVFLYLIGFGITLGLVVLNFSTELLLGREGLWSFIGPVFWGVGSWIEEAQPTTISVALSHYGIAFFLMFGGFYFAIKKKASSLFIVWTIILALATLGQRRWDYYFTVNVALLTSILIFQIRDWMKPEPVVRAAAVVIMCIFLILPNIRATVGVTTIPNNLNQDWYNAMVWMRENTPEPFPKDSYYELSAPTVPKPTHSLVFKDEHKDIIDYSESGHAQGVATDGTYIWYSCSNAIKKTYLNNPDWDNPLAINTHAATDGTEVDQINGIYPHEDYIYATAPIFLNPPYKCFIKRYDKDTLEFVDEKEIFWEVFQDTIGSGQEGLTFHNGYWWIAHYSWLRVSQYDEDFNYIGTFRIENARSQGIAWYGNKLFVARDGGYGIGVYEAKWGGIKLTERIPIPENLPYPQGIAIDGDTLWWAGFEGVEGKTYNNLLKFDIKQDPREVVRGADYGVLTWWDYGHWVIRIAHRVPITSPTNQGREEPSLFLSAQSEEEANKHLEGWNIRYVVLDYADFTGKFYAVVQKCWHDISETDKLRQNSMAARLWREETETWKMVYHEGRVKIFERVD